MADKTPNTSIKSTVSIALESMEQKKANESISEYTLGPKDKDKDKNKQADYLVDTQKYSQETSAIFQGMAVAEFEDQDTYEDIKKKVIAASALQFTSIMKGQDAAVGNLVNDIVKLGSPAKRSELVSFINNPDPKATGPVADLARRCAFLKDEKLDGVIRQGDEEALSRRILPYYPKAVAAAKFDDIFVKGTKFAKYGDADKIKFLRRFQQGIKANPDSPHLSNQFSKVINLPRNFLSFKRTRTVGGEKLTTYSTGVAHLGHTKDAKSSKIAIEEALDALGDTEKARQQDAANALVTSGDTAQSSQQDAANASGETEEAWTFLAPKSPYKSVYTSLVDTGFVEGVMTAGKRVANAQKGFTQPDTESMFNRNAQAAIDDINADYDAVIKYNKLKRETPDAKIPSHLKKVAQMTDEQRQTIIDRGKIYFSKSAAYNTYLQGGKWADNNTDVDKAMQKQKQRIDAFVLKSAGKLAIPVPGREQEAEDFKKAYLSKCNAHMRQLYANSYLAKDGQSPLAAFRERYHLENVSDAELLKMVDFSVKYRVYEATNNRNFNKAGGVFVSRTNNHIFHLSAATGLLQSMYGPRAMEGCKSNKDRASMVRMMSQAMDQSMADSHHWELSNPVKAQKYVQDFIKNNPSYLLNPRSLDALHENLKKAKNKLVGLEEVSMFDNIDVAREKRSKINECKNTIKDLKRKIAVGNYLSLAKNFKDVNRPVNNDNKQELGYYSKVTGLNAKGTEGALAQLELLGENDENSRSMMPSIFVSIYEQTSPEFLIEKVVDQYCANMNKGPKPQNLRDMRALAEKKIDDVAINQKSPETLALLEKFNLINKENPNDLMKLPNDLGALSNEDLAKKIDALTVSNQVTQKEVKALLDYRRMLKEVAACEEGVKRVEKVLEASMAQLKGDETIHALINQRSPKQTNSANVETGRGSKNNPEAQNKTEVQPEQAVRSYEKDLVKLLIADIIKRREKKSWQTGGNKNKSTELLKLYQSALDAGVSKDFLKDAVISGKTRTEIQEEIAKTIIMQRLHSDQEKPAQDPTNVTEISMGEPSPDDKAVKISATKMSDIQKIIQGNDKIKGKFQSFVQAFLNAHKSSKGPQKMLMSDKLASFKAEIDKKRNNLLNKPRSGLRLNQTKNPDVPPNVPGPRTQ